MSSLTRRDRNHAEVKHALLRAGCSVYDAAHVGGGFPDLVVGRIVGGAPRTFMLEVKDGALSPSRRKLNEAETAWHASWLGHVAVVTSVAEALRAVELLP